MDIDLHSHSNASDGRLSPQELVDHAMDRQVRVLSITDHDTITAYEKLGKSRIHIVPGIELSSQWRNCGIHIVGLNIDLDSPSLQEAIRKQQQSRRERAGAIAAKLEKRGIQGALDGAAQIAGNENIGRPHFARYLVDIGASNSISEAFNRYLSSGKAGDIRRFWPDITEIVEWINAAGGIATVAHPLTYKLSRTKLSELLDDFVAAGGRAMEVVSGNQPAHLVRDMATLCQEKNLLASCGSDFHQPDQPWADLGRFPPLPRRCRPVWEHF